MIVSGLFSLFRIFLSRRLLPFLGLLLSKIHAPIRHEKYRGRQTSRQRERSRFSSDHATQHREEACWSLCGKGSVWGEGAAFFSNASVYTWGGLYLADCTWRIRPISSKEKMSGLAGGSSGGGGGVNATLNGLLEKTSNWDKDERYMATNDLCNELQKDIKVTISMLR